MLVWHTTLLDLVARLTDRIDRNEDVIAAAAFLIGSGLVRLSGTFAGCALTWIGSETAEAGWAFSSPEPDHARKR